MNYNQLKKLDEDTLQKLTEGSGPTDECLCSLLSPPDDEPRGVRASIKKLFGTLGGQKKRKNFGGAEVFGGAAGSNSIDIPLTFTKGGKGIYSTREAIKRNGSCGKCGCDNENVIMKHSYANIRITSPDVSSICPCPSDCLPDKEKFSNNIKVTIEQMRTLDVEEDGSEYRVEEEEDWISIREPEMERRPASKLLQDMFRTEETEGGSVGRESSKSESVCTLVPHCEDKES